ncbi:hypothetical protein EJ04DRAFT_473926 [Polyplosphaeria fusca]|uniref:LysM domain-containing protein n=1 Tax=Polyplosphaeria fusca TaxID=682080 RepID=A0A9P4UYQ9_9PLEO|nr:hypothetical protein EJ04DRAFT_473926 [Polyplosphaeria fusca]
MRKSLQKMISLYLRSLLVVLGFSHVAYSQSYFFNDTQGLGPDAAPLSQGCSDALNASIPECHGYFLWIMQSGWYGSLNNVTYQDILCNQTCGTAFNNYRAKVTSACAKDPQPLPGIPATYWVDSALSAFKSLCLKDSSTGQYCTDYTAQLYNSTTEPDDDLLKWPKAQLCSPCMVSLFRQIQSTPYSNYDDDMAQTWSNVQSQCGISYPTTVPALQTNVTDRFGFADPGSGYSYGCLTGKTYNVQSGDNCETIAEKNNVSTGTLITVNQLLPDCTDLQADQALCLPPTCSSYIVQSGDTCLSIANTTGIDFYQILAWNPTINNYCTNLLSGRNICVSPPGGTRALTTIPGATATNTAIYATTTASPPSPIASGTTRKCGTYYLVQPNDYCQLVALNKTISLGLFLAINPSIDSQCSNLLTGEYYCVMPTADWNITASSTVVSAPTTVPTGTTPDCYEWYVIQSGDFCGKLEDQFAITFKQLQFWNPSLTDDCANLQLNDAYCVNGAQQPPTAIRIPEPSGDGEGLRRRSEREPRETGVVVEGGVPVGWPLINAPRVRLEMVMGS